jgi:uncharacterized alkaline shock family protein YloU
MSETMLTQPPAREDREGQRTDTGAARMDRLHTEQGNTTIAQVVVEKIAGLAARQISGVHAMGTRTSSTIGSLKGMVTSSGPSASQGVSVEVGERQAAIDLDLIVEYGVPIVDLASAVRRNVIQQVQMMTGLEVTEVNISVDDVAVPGTTEPQEARVV